MWHPGRREPFLFMLFSLVFVGWWIYLSNDNDQADPRVEKNKRTWMTKRVSTAPVVVPKFSFRDRWNSNTWQRINVILIFLRYLFMFVSVSLSLSSYLSTVSKSDRSDPPPFFKYGELPFGTRTISFDPQCNRLSLCDWVSEIVISSYSWSVGSSSPTN